MASLLQRLSLALSHFLPQAPEFMLDGPTSFFRTLAAPPIGTSKRTVAQDRRRAARVRAKARAKKHGQA